MQLICLKNRLFLQDLALKSPSLQSLYLTNITLCLMFPKFVLLAAISAFILYCNYWECVCLFI